MVTLVNEVGIKAKKIRPHCVSKQPVSLKPTMQYNSNIYHRCAYNILQYDTQTFKITTTQEFLDKNPVGISQCQRRDFLTETIVDQKSTEQAGVVHNIKSQ